MDQNERELCYKELDHIQAILGRHDTFFFLMKQVCLAAIGGLFAVSATNKLKIMPMVIFVVPLLFLFIEIVFRFNYWTRYVDRIWEIGKYMRGENGNIKLYEIVKQRGSILEKKRWRRAIKVFDVIYYGIWAVAALIAGCVLIHDN